MFSIYSNIDITCWCTPCLVIDNGEYTLDITIGILCWHITLSYNKP